MTVEKGKITAFSELYRVFKEAAPSRTIVEGYDEFPGKTGVGWRVWHLRCHVGVFKVHIRADHRACSDSTLQATAINTSMEFYLLYELI